MKKAWKWIVGVTAGALALAVAFVATYEPEQRPAPDITVETGPEVVARGAYLANHVTGCTMCHSPRDESRYGGPVSGPLGAGGACYGEEAGLPGVVCMPNITPHDTAGIGAWTDGEVLRALREGVDRQGRALFPMMPYESYRHLSDEDAEAIVAYLRTLAPSDAKPRGETAIAFPMSFLIKLSPAPVVDPVPTPSRDDEVAYGGYLATIAGCRSCHTPVDERHQPIEGKDMAGGQVHHNGHAEVVAPNLTPHATGLQQSRAQFIALFKSFASDEAAAPVAPADNTVMPWPAYAQMTEEDLGAIHAYLSSLPAIDNPVERRPQTTRVAERP